MSLFMSPAFTMCYCADKMCMTAYRADGVLLGSDLTRACVSPDDVYCAVGSADGAVHVWDLQTSSLATNPLTGQHT